QDRSAGLAKIACKFGVGENHSDDQVTAGEEQPWTQHAGACSDLCGQCEYPGADDRIERNQRNADKADAAKELTLPGETGCDVLHLLPRTSCKPRPHSTSLAYHRHGPKPQPLVKCLNERSPAQYPKKSPSACSHVC